MDDKTSQLQVTGTGGGGLAVIRQIRLLLRYHYVLNVARMLPHIKISKKKMFSNIVVS